VTASPAASRVAGWVLLLGLVLLGVNLRPAAVAVGPVLAEVVDGLAMSHTAAGLLTSLPVLAFAGFGALAPSAARVVGVHRVTLLALLAVVAGLALRAVVDGVVAFLALSLLALSGMAAANVLLPSLVKLHFPRRVGLVTGVYTTAMALGLTAALTLTVPIAEEYGGWRVGLGVWAAVALVAALPWLGLARHDRHLSARPHDVRLTDVARTRLGWAMAVFFGLQASQAYAIFGWFAQLWRDNGYSPAEAGGLVGVVAAVSIPVSLLVPVLAVRRPDQKRVVVAVMACYPVGYAGLLLAPHGGALAWAVLVGIGACTFPLILTMISLRARTPTGTAALSGFTQSVGYLLAAVGPFSVGVLYDHTGGWTWPLATLLGLCVPQLLLGLYVARPVFLEDELRGT
jgi:CP family cyanate transporter-like MFS transporter